MINIKEIIDELVEAGLTKEEALAQAREEFNSRSKHLKKEEKIHAAKQAKMFNSSADNCVMRNLKKRRWL